MNARPEAETEYSRGQRGSSDDFHTRSGLPQGSSGKSSGRLRAAVLCGGLLGAALLLVAEFSTLFTVRSSASPVPFESVTTGSHDSYALIPVAVLAALLSVEAARTGSRLALAAIGVMGLVALGIALAHDLPDARATGVIGSTTTSLRQAGAKPAVGLYLETLGAVVMLITAVAGLLLLPSPDRTVTVAGAPPVEATRQKES